MNKEKLIEEIQKYLNGKDITNEIEVTKSMDALSAFQYRTAKRLIIAFDLWKNDSIFWNDFLLALRDFLILFETSLKFDLHEIPEENDFAIKRDSITGKYYATFQFPNGVKDNLVEQVYMRNLHSKKVLKNYNLATDISIYKLTSFKYFKSIAQKLAVYGALNTPEGYTTLVSLPTGGGKSLITQMLAYTKEGLSVVVVPTVSLADDQVIAAKNIIKGHDIDQEIFAYKSGTDIVPILKAIKEKTAKLLFISPEALLNNQGFEEVIKVANQQRYLRNIIVDEAHIVVDWGASFRVDYQCLEAWRKRLLSSNPLIRTFLLSATYEPKCIDILKTLFSDGEKWIEIRCDALRHEPRYMLIQEKDLRNKDKKTIDLVKKLPHPMIIYVAKPNDAERIKQLLNQNGIHNVYTYTGLTKQEQREKILIDWKEDRFQVMVATSAFGVGVDKPDVRTVLHLYIPPNPNAYYQELGRGGRDKLPCLSVMCTYPDDLHIAFQRISKRVMTVDKIIGRWNSMYNNKSSIRDGEITHINTAIKPNYNIQDEWEDTPTSDADMNWNIYVLLLFRRYKLIEIISIINENGIYTISIKILDERIRIDNIEQRKLIEKIRSEEWNYYNDSYGVMEKAIKDSENSCWSEMFFSTYDRVYEYCAGCNNHEEINDGTSNIFPLKKSIKHPVMQVSVDQKAIFEGLDELVILSPNEMKNKLFQKLDELRVDVMIASSHQLEDYKYFECSKSKNNTFLIGVRELRELLKTNNYYYISGLVVVMYPKEDRESLDLYKTVNKYLCGKKGIYVIHVLEKNIYIPSIDKNIVDLINGRVLPLEILE